MYWTALGIDSNDFLAGVFCFWLSYDENVLFDVTSLMWALQLCTFQWIKSYSELTAWDTRTARWRHKRNWPPNSDLELEFAFLKILFCKNFSDYREGWSWYHLCGPMTYIEGCTEVISFLAGDTRNNIQIMQHPDVNICRSRRLCYPFQLIYKPVTVLSK